MDAILLQNQLQSDLEKKIETIRREAYELGWEQAKSKKDRKNDWFNVSQLGVRFLAYRNVQVTNKVNSQKLTLRCCYVLGGFRSRNLINNEK